MFNVRQDVLRRGHHYGGTWPRFSPSFNKASWDRHVSASKRTPADCVAYEDSIKELSRQCIICLYLSGYRTRNRKRRSNKREERDEGESICNLSLREQKRPPLKGSSPPSPLPHPNPSSTPLLPHPSTACGLYVWLMLTGIQATTFQSHPHRHGCCQVAEMTAVKLIRKIFNTQIIWLSVSRVLQRNLVSIKKGFLLSIFVCCIKIA